MRNDETLNASIRAKLQRQVQSVGIITPEELKMWCWPTWALLVRRVVGYGNALILLKDWIQSCDFSPAELNYIHENLPADAWAKLGLKLPPEEKPFEPWVAFDELSNQLVMVVDVDVSRQSNKIRYSTDIPDEWVPWSYNLGQPSTRFTHLTCYSGALRILQEVTGETAMTEKIKDLVQLQANHRPVFAAQGSVTPNPKKRWCWLVKETHHEERYLQYFEEARHLQYFEEGWIACGKHIMANIQHYEEQAKEKK